MATKKEKEVKSTSLQVFSTIEESIVLGIQVLNNDTVGAESDFKIMIDQYENLDIDGLNDLAGFNLIKESEKKLKKIISEIKKRRKELTAPALEFQSALIEEENRLIEIVQPMFNKISGIRQDFEDKKKAEEMQVFNDRCTQLVENGYIVVGSSYICGIMSLTADLIKSQSPEEFEVYIKEGKKEQARKKAEDERVEAEKIELQKLKDEIKAEKDTLAKERAEFTAQKLALEEHYQTIEKAPETTPETAVETTPEKSVSRNPVEEEVIPKREPKTVEFLQGFVSCKDIILAKFKSGDKLSRGEWVEFINNLVP
jgi:predicted  nucleic acid-binding Zn-ribbon protein